jgi:hypothetical protein
MGVSSIIYITSDLDEQHTLTFFFQQMGVVVDIEVKEDRGGRYALAIKPNSFVCSAATWKYRTHIPDKLGINPTVRVGFELSSHGDWRQLLEDITNAVLNMVRETRWI